MEGINVPLSCYRGTHFYRKVGKAEICMYCGYGFITRTYGESKITLIRNPLFNK